jgi:hypothetical protein
MAASSEAMEVILVDPEKAHLLAHLYKSFVIITRQFFRSVWDLFSVRILFAKGILKNL